MAAEAVAPHTKGCEDLLRREMKQAKRSSNEVSSSRSELTKDVVWMTRDVGDKVLSRATSLTHQKYVVRLGRDVPVRALFTQGLGPE